MTTPTSTTTSTTPPTIPHPISHPFPPSTPRPPLSTVLPPLLFGTATFNHQYNVSPDTLPTTSLIHRALTHGIRAFDTSPYYGPSESLLGAALASPAIAAAFPRASYMLVTKVGRVAGSSFDYSAAWVRRSVLRSCRRLRTDYLDLVYCHDVEFVSVEEVLEAVGELRRLRDEGRVGWVGVSGFPVERLVEVARVVRERTGEPLDAVMSYAQWTVQNGRLGDVVGRFKEVGVEVVVNASMLGMGLLRNDGVPVGALGDWHPAPRGLREAVGRAAEWLGRFDERLEVVALRWALESWIAAGAQLGSAGRVAGGVEVAEGEEATVEVSRFGRPKMGVSVMGVSRLEELEKTMRVWRCILDGLELDDDAAAAAERGGWKRARQWSRNRREAVELLAEGVREVLGEWRDFAWESPGPGFVNCPRETLEGRGEEDMEEEEELGEMGGLGKAEKKGVVESSPQLRPVQGESVKVEMEMPKR